MPALVLAEEIHLRLAGVAGSGCGDAVAIIEDTVTGDQVALFRGEKTPSYFSIPLRLIEVGPDSVLVRLRHDAVFEIGLNGAVEVVSKVTGQTVTLDQDPDRFWGEMNGKAPEFGAEWLN